MGVWYASREDVKAALDFKETARNNGQVDRAVESASRAVEGLTHRRFYPETDTRYFDWPDDDYGRPWRLYLHQHEVISVTTLSSGGDTISASDYFLEPVNDGPPYSRIEIDLSSSASFGGGSTHQRDITVTGVFGYSADTTAAGALAEALDSSETDVDVTDSSLIGVGDIIVCESEYMTVTGRSMLDTTQDIGADLASSNAAVTVAVTTGSSYTVGETILIDAERMLIVDIAGNNLIVKRAFDGSVLAAHTSGADVYAPRTLTVVRGSLGTTAAAHDTATAVRKHEVPALIRQLTIAEAVSDLMNQSAAYARTVGSGDNEREASGRALRSLRDQVKARYGRNARVRAV